ncbi:YiiD C-terminal domain-containing protein [Reinekea marina]|uniref:YiiD C-terminal domain-containing protein n=1 Tax=Reinekea marina TaxID=1310421 RepID=A0ABV7WUI5_9GAMM|nr:YiiD C-terminal domain-containing protein [Reinekea marina]MDN3649821.1 YiiD C-terminal domain-containing protein [Reinekea marina]
MNLEAIEPIKPLGVKKVSCDSHEAVFTMPIEGNRNDKGTFFAGSQYSTVVLTGWYLCSHWASEHGFGEKVAIKSGEVSYPKAALSNITVTAHFKEAPVKRPSGHLKAIVDIIARDETGEVVCTFLADYRILQ